MSGTNIYNEFMLWNMYYKTHVQTIKLKELKRLIEIVLYYKLNKLNLIIIYYIIHMCRLIWAIIVSYASVLFILTL